MFGTLHVPSRERENLAFGVEAGKADVHTLTEVWIAPVQRAVKLLASRFAKRGDTAPPADGVAAPDRVMRSQ
jgi:hypothetical protein